MVMEQYSGVRFANFMWAIHRQIHKIYLHTGISRTCLQIKFYAVNYGEIVFFTIKNSEC
jgi:hypothetical protein